MADIVYSDSFNPYENLALEEWLFSNADKPTLYLWQNERTVVIGNHQNAYAECNLSTLYDDGGLLARRTTGGGAVYHDLGNLNFSFICAENEFDVKKNLEVITRALARYNIKAVASGRNDIEVCGKKVSGNAFLHSCGKALHHGTLLVSSDLAGLNRYLCVSERKLEAKGIKSVRARVANLSEFAPITTEKLKKSITEEYTLYYGDAKTVIVARSDYSDLIAKFASEDFRLGMNPPFTTEISERFIWGSINVRFEVKCNKVVNCKAYTDALDVTLSEKIENVFLGAEYTPDDISCRAEKLIAFGGEYTDVASLIIRSVS